MKSSLWRSSDRGAVLIHVAIALVAMMALSAFAIDYGVKWVARGQAQNAADSAARAGAIALAYDDPALADPSPTGVVKQSALRYALSHQIWREPPVVDPATDIRLDPCPNDGSNTCVTVDVFRNQVAGNPLPTFFAQLVGVMAQGVQATATAQAAVANASDCLEPWAIIDKWDEFSPSGVQYPAYDPDYNAQNSTFDKYRPKNPQPDLYVAPSGSGPGTGYTVAANFGTQITIKVGPSGQISSGWFRSVVLPRAEGNETGAEPYRENIKYCNGVPVGIAPPDVVCPDDGAAINDHEERVYWAARGCLRVQTGNMVGPTRQGVETHPDSLIARDPNAYWNPSLNNGTGGIANSCCDYSPRIKPIALFDIDAYLASDPNGSGSVVRVVNILGFFIEGMNGQEVTGRLVTAPGLKYGNGTNLNGQSAFLKAIILIR